MQVKQYLTLKYAPIYTFSYKVEQIKHTVQITYENF